MSQIESLAGAESLPRKRNRHQRRARNRETNPVPFWQRELVTPTEAIHHLCFGRHKLDQLIEEGRIDTTVIDCRRYIITGSLKRLIDAGRKLRLPEPPQMARVKTGAQGAV
jgi:hypothetical protein